MMSSKKEKEYSILKAVYDVSCYDDVIASEEPDFIIKKSEKTVGVEVTELYANSSNARLRNITNYVDELLDSKKYRHKEDVLELKVDNIQIFDKNNEFVAESNAIFRGYPKVEEFIKVFLNIIQTKENKYDRYISNVQYVDLIINDTERYFVLYNEKEVNEILLSVDIRDILIKTRFREIYLITKLKTREDDTIVINYKLTSLLIDLYLVIEPISLFYCDACDEFQFKVLVKYLIMLGYKVELMRDNLEKYIINMEGNFIKYEDDGPNVYLTNDNDFSNKYIKLEILRDDLYSNFIDAAKNRRKLFTFSAIIAYPIKDKMN